MIHYKSYKQLLQVLFNLTDYFHYKNPAQNIELDYVIGKKKLNSQSVLNMTQGFMAG